MDADNFVLLRPAPAPECRQIAGQFVDAVHRALTEPIRTPAVSIPVRADCGIAVYPDDGNTAATVIRTARRALQQHRGLAGSSLS
jgi:GGDEF domain-containing protein